MACAVWTGACFSQHPLSFRFWIPASWNTGASAICLTSDPLSGQGAITDPSNCQSGLDRLRPPALTHCDRSYDYSKYRRRVAGGTTGVPADTDYIVIDTRHPYSWIKGPEDVRELQTDPDQWELLPDQTEAIS